MPHSPTLLFLTLAPWLAQVEETLRVCNWNDYIGPQVLESFQKDTGICAGYYTFATAGELDRAPHSSEAINVAVPPRDTLSALLKGSLLQPLDLTQPPNRNHLDRQLLSKLAAVDLDNRHTAPYLWGAIGLATSTPQAEVAYDEPLPNSWGLLFDASQGQRLKSYGISLPDALDETLAILLNYQGRNLDRTAPSQVCRAAEVLRGLRPNLRYVDSEHCIVNLEDGRLCLTMTWIDDALRAAETGQLVSFEVPQEGSVLFIDNLVVPAGTQHPREAHRFVDYLMQPKIAAQITAATPYPSGNTDAAGFLDPVPRQRPGLYPDHDTNHRLFALGTPPEKLRPVVDGIWKTLRGASH